MEHDPGPQSIEYGSIKAYIVGFILSAILTLLAFALVMNKWVQGVALAGSVTLLALVQAFTQLILFLNLLREPKPRWNLVVFLFMVMVILILVFGSLWIMNQLAYNEMR